METYAKIKALCDEHRTTVTALEAALGFSRGSIGKLKNGAKPSLDRMQKIAEYFGVDPSYFFSDEPPIGLQRVDMAELIHEAQIATPENVRAAVMYLKRLNTYEERLRKAEQNADS